MNVDHEVSLLVDYIKKLGDGKGDGLYEVTFKTLFDDDEVANTLEALVGTLRAAKKRKIINYEGELLLQGVHDKTIISLKE